MAAQSGIEKAGEDSFAQRQSSMLGKGFSFSGYERDTLYLNQGEKQFVNISGISGIDAIGDGRSAIFADFDNDGDLDVFLASIQGRAHQLFRNNIGQERHWLRISLKGEKSGPDAFGAVVRVKTETGVLTKVKAGGSGYLSQHDPRLLFGLDAAESVAWVEVSWPSGAKQRFENVKTNVAILIGEGDPNLVFVKEPVFSLPDPLTEAEQQMASLKIKKGQPFPQLPLTDAKGQMVSTSQVLPKGEPAIVNLWATWCGPCAREMPQLQKLSEKYPIRIVGLSMDEPDISQKVFALLKRNKFTYPNYLRQEATPDFIFATPQISVPLTFLIDEQGLVEEVVFGWSEKISEFAIRSAQ